MTPLPPAPTFNRESVVPATTDGPVAAAAAPLSGAAAGLPVPTGYVLVPIDELRCWRDDLAYYREKERQELLAPMPACLANPSWEYLAAMGPT